MSTQIISYGLQLQVTQPNFAGPFNLNTKFINSTENYEIMSKRGKNSLASDSNKSTLNKRSQRNTLFLLADNTDSKYKVSSDKIQKHILTLNVQGRNDEGTYQVIFFFNL
jgi:hypothetical protein